MKNEDFGERLKLFRNEKGMSIQDLSEKTGISVSLLEAIEMGEKKQRFSYPVLLKISDVLGINFEELVHIKLKGN